jgi:Arc/MetJ family transcription regulator
MENSLMRGITRSRERDNAVGARQLNRIVDVYTFHATYTWRNAVRTNIELDDRLLAEAMKASGLPTKRATVEEALRTLVRQHRQRNALQHLRGLGWEGDLDIMRRDDADDHRP